MGLLRDSTFASFSSGDVITHTAMNARFDAIKTAINGQVAEVNLADSAVARDKMASGNQDVIQTITVPIMDTILTISGNTYPAVSGTSSAPDYSTYVKAKTSGTIVAVDYSAAIVQGEDAIFKLEIGGSVSSATSATLAAGSNKSGEVVGLTVSVSDDALMRVQVLSGNSSATNVGSAFADIYFKRTLA